MADLLSREGIDVACLQETKLATVEQETELINFYKTKFWCYPSSAIGASAGTLILVRKKAGLVVVDCVLDESGRLCVVDAVFGCSLLRIISVYSPNDPTERKAFFPSLRQFVDVPWNVVLGGDFNCVLKKSDCCYSQFRSDASRKELRKLVQEGDLVDIGEELPSGSIQFTHLQGASHARLDRIYTSSLLLPHVKNYEVKPQFFSDHALVMVTVTSGPHTMEAGSQRRGTWKMNDSILEDKDFHACMTDMIEKYQRAGQVNAITWEQLKGRIKQRAIEHSQVRAFKRNQHMKSLMGALAMLAEAECEHPGVYKDDIKNVKDALGRLYEEKYQGALIRSRETSLEQEETPYKIFRFKERERAENNGIKEISTQKGIVTSKAEIEDAFYQNYVELFSEKHTEKEEYVTWMDGFPVIDEQRRELINSDISEDEIRKAIRKLGKNKSPGVDGIGAAFYQLFIDPLCGILKKVFEDISSRGLLPPSMRQSLTVLIPRKRQATRRRLFPTTVQSVSYAQTTKS